MSNSTATVSLSSAIQEYHNLGLTALPCRIEFDPDGNKLAKPSITWQKTPPTLEMALAKTKNPFWNCLAILTGEAHNLFVVDIDMHAEPSGFQTLADHGIEIPDYVPRVRTQSGGMHLYFQFPKELAGIKSTKSFKQFQIDFRGDGGLVFAPPSNIESLRQYEWIIPITGELPRVPDDLLKFILTLCKPERKSTTQAETPKQRASQHTKNIDYETQNIESAAHHLSGRINNYTDWLKVGNALAELGEQGRAYFHIISDNNPAYPSESYESIDRKFSNLLASRSGEVHIASFFEVAKQHGFEQPKRTRQPQSRQDLPDEPPQFDEPPDDYLESYAQRNAPASVPAPKKEKAINTSAIDEFIDNYLYHGEVGIARLIAKLCKGKILYNHTSKAWMRYNHGVWEEDTSAYAEQLAADTIENEFEKYEKESGRLFHIYTDVDTVKMNRYATANNVIVKILKKLKSANGLNNVIKSKNSLIAWRVADLSTSIKEFDNQPTLINLQNGSFDLATGEFYPHSPDSRFMKQAGANYRKQATCPKIIKFLETILVDSQGNPSPDLMGFMQEFLGLCLTGEHLTEHFLYAYGSGGNGKSTLFKLIKYLLNNYMTSIPIRVLMQNGGLSNEFMSSLAGLKGARLIMTSEIPQGRGGLDEELVKDITGGNELKARQKYGIEFELEIIGKLVFVGNHKIRIDDDSGGFWRRLCLLEFNHIFPEETAKDMDSVIAELQGEIDGFLQWAIEGYYRAKKNGFHPPSAVIASTAEYKHNSDILGVFLDECCGVGDLQECKAISLYKAYQAWCKDNSVRPQFHSNPQLQAELLSAKRGFDSRKDHSGTVYIIGIELLQNERGQA